MASLRKYICTFQVTLSPVFLVEKFCVPWLQNNIEIRAPGALKSSLEAWKSSPGSSKIEFGGLLRASWETFWAKDWIFDALGRALGDQNGQLGSHLEAQELPKEAQDRPNPLPNGSRDALKSIFQSNFWMLFFLLEIYINFWWIVWCFFVIFQKLNM